MFQEHHEVVVQDLNNIFLSDVLKKRCLSRPHSVKRIAQILQTYSRTNRLYYFLGVL